MFVFISIFNPGCTRGLYPNLQLHLALGHRSSCSLCQAGLMSSGRAGPGSWRPRARGFIWFILLVRADFSGVVSAMERPRFSCVVLCMERALEVLSSFSCTPRGWMEAPSLKSSCFGGTRPKAWLEELGQLRLLTPGLRFNKAEFSPLFACWVLAFSSLGNPHSSGADLSQQSPFVRPSSGLQGAFIFPSYCS